jgi:hypothetical protein
VAWTSRIDEYLAELTRLGCAQFLSTYPNPLLVHRFANPSARGRLAVTSPARFRTDAPRGPRDPAVLTGGAADLEAGVHPLKKRPGNPYPDTITVGRAETNDIVVPYDDLSKLHAYFTRAPDGAVLVADAGSRNGTWLAGERLAPNDARPLGARYRFGLGEHAF